ncbi:hypothetical protein Agub_g12231, partial [Astrephomene gubernaculifera]
MRVTSLMSAAMRNQASPTVARPHDIQVNAISGSRGPANGDRLACMRIRSRAVAAAHLKGAGSGSLYERQRHGLPSPPPQQLTGDTRGAIAGAHWGRENENQQVGDTLGTTSSNASSSSSSSSALLASSSAFSPPPPASVPVATSASASQRLQRLLGETIRRSSSICSSSGGAGGGMRPTETEAGEQVAAAALAECTTQVALGAV